MIYNYFVYILTNKGQTVLYTGVTNNLCRRIIEHKEGRGSEFTKKYHVHKLVYYEIFTDPENAIKREKQIKNYSRTKKITIITARNPTWEEITLA